MPHEIVHVFGEQFGECELLVDGGKETITPRKLSEEAFGEWLDKIRSGVRSIKARLRVYGEKENANLVRSKPGDINRIAAGAVGAIFLYDHDAWTVRSRKGSALSADVVMYQGVPTLEVLVDITSADAQEAFLRGELDRFSIGLSYVSAECSICGEPVRPSWNGWDFGCDHEIGKRYKTSEGRPKCEVFLIGAELREVSGVNFPAYKGTSVLGAGDCIPIHINGLPVPDETSQAVFNAVTAGFTAGLPDSQKEGKDMAPTDLEKANERIAELEGQLESDKKAALTSTYRQLIDDGYLNPSDKSDFEEMVDTLGVWRAKDFFERRQPQPMAATGEVSTGESQPDAPQYDLNLALAKLYVQHGYVSQATLDKNVN